MTKALVIAVTSVLTCSPVKADDSNGSGTNAMRRVPFRRDDATAMTNAMPVGAKGNYETVQAKILRVFTAEDKGAKFRAYLVKWKDFEVIVSDPLAKTDKKEGDLITFMANRSETLHGEHELRLLHFTVMEFGAPPK